MHTNRVFTTTFAMPDSSMPQTSNVTSLAERRLLHEAVIDQLRDLIVQGGTGAGDQTQ